MPSEVRSKDWQPSQRKALLDPSSFATTLVTVFLDNYGVEGLDWTPETMCMELQDDYQIALPRLLFDRLIAGVSLMKSDRFYKSLPDFITLCNILSGDSFDPTTFDPAEADEIAWGISETLLLAPPEEHEENPFSQEIVAYIGEVLKREGIIRPPDVLKLGLRGDASAIYHLTTAQWQDDPELVAKVAEVEQGKSRELSELVKGNLRRLFEQLQQLTLRHGDTRSITEKVQQHLQAMT